LTPLLYPVEHDVPGALLDEWAVIAAIAGTPTSNVLRLERSVKHGRGLEGPISLAVLQKMLAALGFKAAPYFGYLPPASLGRFLRDHGSVVRHSAVVIRGPGHLAAVDGHGFVNAAHPAPTPFEKWPKEMKVSDALTVLRVGLPGR
jgi:hypothetical protein